MREPRLNSAREKRISNEIVVDCYSPEESAMGWCYYLEGKLFALLCGKYMNL